MFSMKIKELKGKIIQKNYQEKKSLYDNCKSKAQSIQTCLAKSVSHIISLRINILGLDMKKNMF